MATELKAEIRSGSEFGSGVSRRMRNENILPAVIYGSGIENKSLKVQRKDVERILRTPLGKNTFIDLQVEGDKNYSVLIKEFQGQAVTRELTHIDFWHVSPDQEVEVSVKTILQGKPVGLVKGGILEHISYKVSLLAKASKIPAQLEVDISALDVNQNIHLLDVALPDGVRVREGYNPTIASMVEEKRPAAGAATDAAAAEAPAADAPAQAEGDAKDGDKK